MMGLFRFGTSTPKRVRLPAVSVGVVSQPPAPTSTTVCSVSICFALCC